ncbi:GIY-YIG nuclease family protein [Variovorax sp. VaC1]|uniref:GIY-YIG nuclease family protein n=1 Tax=Variovorax sp. VaC1 TaxID=3373132 RepID=UPI003747B2E6
MRLPWAIRELSPHNPRVPRTPPAPSSTPYWLYLLECEGGVYYVGIAIDVERRFFQHLFGVGAKFTRARPPVRVLAAREYANKGAALRAELQVKALPRARKLAFFAEVGAVLAE